MPLFKPGQSGNPRGRPKGSHNIAREFLAEIERTAPDAAGQMSKLQALIKAQIDKAVQGDNRAIEAVLDRMEALEVRVTASVPKGPDFTDADREIIADIHRRLTEVPLVEGE
ncbi:MAG: DUF5681 domain-containing protein [Rhizomicrobium sp.]